MPGHSKRKVNPNATPPKRGEVAYKNKALIARICARIAQGVPYGPAGMCEGLARDTVSCWLSRASKNEAEGVENKALADAASAIVRARGEAEARASSLLLNDPKNAPEFWAKKQMRQEFGDVQTIQVEGIDPAQAVGIALQNLLSTDE